MTRAPNSTLSFAYLLPLVELLVCWTILPISNPGIFRQLAAALHGPDSTAVPLSQGDRLAAAFKAADEWHAEPAQVIWLVNMPGIWAEVATSHSTWPDSWYPSSFPDLFAWRAVLFPIGALPFWFAAGRGVDWFLNRRRAPFRLARTVVLLASIAALFGAIQVPLEMGHDDPSLRPPALSNALVVAGAFWFLLGAIPCAAAIVQWRSISAARCEKKSIQGSASTTRT